MQSPGVMSLTRPPLAAMTRAARSIAGPNVDVPTVLVSRSSFRAAIPAGSRVRAISSATRTGDAVASSQGSPGRRMSPPISWTMPIPSTLRICLPRGPRLPAASRPASIRSRQSAVPSAPAPEASHRSCHVVPGCSSSQSRIFSMASFREYRAFASPTRNGGASIRRATANRSAAVVSQTAGTGRGGNFATTARASELSCQGRATALAGAAAVTSGPCRTARPGSRDGKPASARQAGPTSVLPADGDGPACSR